MTNQTNTERQVILTGDRATGPLHLGHYVGSLKQRVSLQDEHDQTILVADMQGLTDNAHNPSKVSSSILNVVADYLAVGIDPRKTTVCLQSQLPALAELTMYYSNVVTVTRLERNPTVKSEIKSIEVIPSNVRTNGVMSFHLVANTNEVKKIKLMTHVFNVIALRDIANKINNRLGLENF